mgnify:FL=1
MEEVHVKEQRRKGLVEVQMVVTCQYSIQVGLVNLGEGKEVDVIMWKPEELGDDQAQCDG